MDQAFSVIEKCDASRIKSLIIQQANYDRYKLSLDPNLVIIPETVSRLVAVETIKINACIKELPVALTKLNNLKLLDLSGCYNLFSIPEAVFEMKDLKIKIGDIISRASEVVFIPVPWTEITPSLFSAISSAKEKKIEQLIIRQVTPKSWTESYEEFEVPDDIKDLHELKQLSITGTISSVPSCIGHLNTLCSLTVNSTRLKSLPESLGNLSNLTSLAISWCSTLKSFPSSMQNLPHLTNVTLTECSFESLPSGIEYLKEVTELDLSNCYNLKSLPESMGNLSKLTSLNLSGCSNLRSLPSSIWNLSKLTTLNISSNRYVSRALRELPESIGNLSNLTSLDLSGCENLESLPETVGNLSNLTSLDLRGCYNLTSFPTSLHSLSHLETPLFIAGIFPIPSDMDWSQFKTLVNVVSYVEYMMRRNKISSILSDLQEYMRKFDSDYYYFRGYEISTVYGLIERREGRGNDLIGYLCCMLTNDWKMKRERGYMNEILEWRNDEKKRDGMGCLKILLFMKVYGMQMKGEDQKMVSTGRRMVEVWKEEGKEDSEGRREWEKRWREVGDIMNEEDVMETSIMHLCIPNYEQKEKDGLILPSKCSLNALSVLLNEELHGKCTYHFPV